MARLSRLNHEFIRSAPEMLEPGVLYVSMEFASAVHLCCCGCGAEIVTPLSPKDWKITYNGESITLHPSIGNWSFACRSHYWIRADRVDWAGDMSDEDIWDGRKRDRQNRTSNASHENNPRHPQKKTPKRGFWKKLFGIFD